MQKRFQHRFTLPAIITLLVLAILGSIFGFYQMTQTTTYPENNSAKVMGVLIDQNLGYVDFDSLSQADVDFVYLRSTQGKSYFDDRYLENRDRIQGTTMDYGTVQYFSDQSTALEQFNYFEDKVGTKTGRLPVLIMPAVETRSASYLKSLNQFAEMLIAKGEQIVLSGIKLADRSYFTNQNIYYMTAKAQLKPTDKNYLFWRYTTDGRVGHMDGMDDLTMYAFVGSQASYDRFLGKE